MLLPADNPLSLKADFILSLCELIVGGKNGLEPVEKTIIDRCVRLVYQEYLADPVPEKMPILEDLYTGQIPVKLLPPAHAVPAQVPNIRLLDHRQ